MAVPSRECRGSLLQGQFIRTANEHGVVHSRHPGNLTLPQVAYAFSYDHVGEATRSAARAFPAWRKERRETRAELLGRFADLLESRCDDIAWVLVFETGKPFWDAKDEVTATADFVRAAASKPPHAFGGDIEQGGMAGSIRTFPRGVAAVIPPGSEPVYGSATFFVPALLEGNTVVLKSAKNAPATAQLLAELLVLAGFPSGVVGMIHGDSTVAQRLCADPEVQTIFFSGHFEAALEIRKQIASDPTKTLIANTGGKSSAVVFADAPYEKALYETFGAAFRTAGQLWLSTHRIAVDAAIFDKFVEDFHVLAKKARISYPLEESGEPAFFGPLLNEAMLENYLRFQGIAVREGCEEIMRGKALEKEKPGHYVSPSLHIAKSLDPKSTYQRTETYGPNVCFYRLSADEDASALLEQTPYGLAASIYSASRERFDRVLAEAPVGILHWNRPTTARNLGLAPGGLRRSGSGRPMGVFAPLQCSTVVSSWLEKPGAAVERLPGMPKLG